MKKKNSLGCGTKIKMNTNSGFICGVANAWGEERLCEKCQNKLKERWSKGKY